MNEAVGVGLQVASALGAAHAQGIVHRDIKPSNVFLADWRLDRVKLLDYGIARQRGTATLTELGMVVGTPAYMAPEQARGERELDARADVYALGALLFRCLAGRPPFEAETREELARGTPAAAGATAGRLRQRSPLRSRSLVARMLDKDPRPTAGGRTRRLGSAVCHRSGAGCRGATAARLQAVQTSQPPLQPARVRPGAHLRRGAARSST